VRERKRREEKKRRNCPSLLQSLAPFLPPSLTLELPASSKAGGLARQQSGRKHRQDRERDRREGVKVSTTHTQQANTHLSHTVCRLSSSYTDCYHLNAPRFHVSACYSVLCCSQAAIASVVPSPRVSHRANTTILWLVRALPLYMA